MTRINHTTTHRYHLPSVHGEGWCIAFLDTTGAFACLSDWGDYAYRWSPGGLGGREFRAFLTSCDDGYILNKLAQGKVEYQGEATVANIKKVIVECRRDGDLSKQEAREDWENLQLYSVSDSEYGFWRWLEETTIGDAHELSIADRPVQARAFMKSVWPRLKAAIDADLSRTLGASPEEQLAAAQEEVLDAKNQLVQANRRWGESYTERAGQNRRINQLQDQLAELRKLLLQASRELGRTELSTQIISTLAGE